MALAEFDPAEISSIDKLHEQFVHYCQNDWRINVTPQQINAMTFEVFHKVGLKLYLNDLQSEIDNDLILSTDPDGVYIVKCKEFARKLKVPYQYLLSKFRPRGVLNRPVWNDIGDLVPWETMYR
jgi:hypothetical protein